MAQPYDFTGACELCGAGSRPIPPLFIDSHAFGRKKLDTTPHDGLILVARELANVLMEHRVTGFDLLPVAHKTETNCVPLDDPLWLVPSVEWPRLAPTSIVAVEDLCARCGRSGHFDSPQPATELCYTSLPAEEVDWGLTYEYFGVWRYPGKRLPNVGGARLPIVSRRLRDLLLRAKVRHLAFEPLTIQRGDA